MAAYYFSATLPAGFDDAVKRTTEALKREGFGIITEIDVRRRCTRSSASISATTRSWVHATWREALKAEDKVGTMLPCNVVVQGTGNGKVEVAAIDPVASMAAIDNPGLKQLAQKVRDKLKTVIAGL
jgi:uncharacterized protein (DUF302 family)